LKNGIKGCGVFGIVGIHWDQSNAVLVIVIVLLYDNHFTDILASSQDALLNRTTRLGMLA
jgi:hypothetical protein